MIKGCFPWLSVSGLRCPFVGGNANNGGHAGVSYVNANNSPSTANANGSAPLYLSPWSCLRTWVNPVEKTSAHAEKYTSDKVLVGQHGWFERSYN